MDAEVWVYHLMFFFIFSHYILHVYRKHNKLKLCLYIFLNTYNCKSFFFLLWVYKTPSLLFKTCLILSIACVVTTHFNFFSKCVLFGTKSPQFQKKKSKCVDIVELMLTHFENKNIQGLVVIIDSFICNASKRLFSSKRSDTC